MAGTAAEAQVNKKCYKNQTAGWLGVVKLDHLGAQQGFAVKPHSTVYLSDEEAILTARAPADPADNPFVEQQFMFEDASGNRVEQGMRPLVLTSEDDPENPGDGRFVPGLEQAGPPPAHVNVAAVAAASQETADALAAESDRPVPTDPVSTSTLVPTMATAVSPDYAGPEVLPTEDVPEGQPESWVEAPDRTEAPQPGSLKGDAALNTASDQTAPEAAKPPQQPVQQPVPVRATSSVEPGSADPVTQPVVPSESAGTQTAAGSPSEQSTAAPAAAEEHAGVTPAGEETGAAETPAGEPPAGEYAANEEVGTPDAPTQEDTSA
jgi:hypothetical protein